jgi:hypothetical protein
MEVKSKSRIKSYNSGEKNVECGTFENNLIDQHDKKIFYCRFRKMILKFKKLVNKFEKNKKKITMNVHYSPSTLI